MVSFEDAMGYSAAGTLGFILGDVPGAFAGVNAYKGMKEAGKSFQNMFKRRRSSSTSGTTYGTRTPRKKTKFAKKRKTSKVAYKKASASGNTFAVASRKTGYVSRYPRKPVKVSRKLRAKIMKVLESDKLIGRYTHVSYYQLTPGIPYGGGTNDMQSYEYAGMLTTSASGSNRLLFSPMYVNYAVSRLMNPAQVTKAMGQPIDYRDFTTDKKFLLLERGIIKVLQQSATYRIRNNTGRVVTLKIFCLQPKSRSTINAVVGSTPLDVWNSALDLQDTDTPANPAYKFENPLSVRMETLYSNPKQLASFRNFYKVEETIVTLEPGKEYLYKVVGPSMKYDFAKYWTGFNYIDQQKFTKQVMFLAYNDLTRTTTGLSGRYTDHVNGDPSSLVIEQTTYIKFAIPEQVGFGIGDTFILGENQNLNQKRNCFGIDVHQGAQTGTVDYVGDENPIDEANPTVI